MSQPIKVISEMIGHKYLIEKYPLSVSVIEMMTHKEMLGKIIEENAKNADFGA